MATSVAVAIALVAILAVTGVGLVDLLYGKQNESVRQGVRDYLFPSLLSYPALAVVSVGCGVLRGSGDTRTPMAITMMMGILNAILAALLIYGLRINLFSQTFGIRAYGVEGAALALLFSRIFAAGLISYVLLKGQRAIKFTIKGFRFHMGLQRSLLAIGIPMTMENVLFQIGKVITGIIIVKCGDAQMNANIIAGSIFSLICIPGNAFTIAAMPLVGQSVGRGDYSDARDKLLFVNWVSSLGLVATCALMMLFSNQLVGLYSTDTSVIPIAVSMLKVVAVLMPPFWSVSFVLPAGLKGAGDVTYSMVTTIIGMWVFRVLLGYILGITMGMGAVGVYIAMCVDWVVRGTLYYIRVRGASWYKQHAKKMAAALQIEQP